MGQATRIFDVEFRPAGGRNALLKGGAVREMVVISPENVQPRIDVKDALTNLKERGPCRKTQTRRCPAVSRSARYV